MTEGHTPGTSPAQIAPGGGWRPDGTYESPEGWPEGAGWIVRDGDDGPIINWGPASDLALIVTTDIGDEGPMPPAEDLDARLLGSVTGPVPPRRVPPPPAE